MLLARVVGTVVATRKDAGLAGGVKLLVIEPLRPDRTPAGKPLVAVDSVGAGAGEDVFYVRGREASFPFLPAEVPTDASIIGIVDRVSC
jgi:microcompartment protein CcmK/EutM